MSKLLKTYYPLYRVISTWNTSVMYFKNLQFNLLPSISGYLHGRLIIVDMNEYESKILLPSISGYLHKTLGGLEYVKDNTYYPLYRVIST